MIGLYHSNGDIEFYFRHIDVAEFKMKKEGLEGRLKDMTHSGSGSKFRLQFSELKDMIDGLKVEILPDGNLRRYEIKVNEYALGKMIAEGRWGSRYAIGGEKIDITTETPPRTEAEG